MYIAAAIGAAILHPTVTTLLGSGEPVTFASLPVVAATYASSVIPIVIAVWLASYVEKAVDKVTHASLKLIVVPTVTLLVIVPLTLIAVGPLGVIIGDGLTGGISWLFENTGLFAGLLLGGTMSLLIITGMHYALIPIMIASIAQLGYDYMIPIMMVANFAQAGSALGVSLRTKNSKLKSLSLSTSITAFMGITEPAMYGVNMRLKKPFIAALIGGAAGGAFLSLFKVKAYVIGGLAGLSGIPMVLGATFVYSVIGFAIGAVVAAVVTYIIGFEDEQEAAAAPAVTPAESVNVSAANTTVNGAAAEPKMVNQEVFSPIAGAVKPLSEVSDPAFSEEIMGKGYAIQPSEGRVGLAGSGNGVLALEERTCDWSGQRQRSRDADPYRHRHSEAEGLAFLAEGNCRNPGGCRRSVDGIRSGGDREGWLQHHYASYYYEHPAVSVHPVCWRYPG